MRYVRRLMVIVLWAHYRLSPWRVIVVTGYNVCVIVKVFNIFNSRLVCTNAIYYLRCEMICDNAKDPGSADA